MTRNDEAELLKNLSAAQASPLGLRLEFLDPSAALLYRTKLYEVRKAHTEYTNLSFVVTGPVLMILKRAAAEETYDDPFEAEA